MKKSTTITYVTTSALLGMLTVLMIPSGIADSSEFAMYGMATITQQDVDGNTIFEQSVHNRLFDAGEDNIIDNTFTGLTDTADNVDIGAICLGAQTPSTTEGDAAGAWGTAHDAADNASANSGDLNCKTFAITGTSGQIATIGPLTFTANQANNANWWGW
ncbi:MAG: hypothetical protein HRU07_00745 [Nitrosopumilus sp.]|nr:hypothetical protein [Nitrosopumilus sp.]NRA04705.1 hypothetical protein [Nitrosopumilus sp.]